MGNGMIQRTVHFRQRGEAGVSIVSANVWYALTKSRTQEPADSAFSYDDFPTTLNAGYYVWQCTKITDSTGKTTVTGKICLGATTDFLSGSEVYAVSQSNSEVPTSWSTSYKKTFGYFLWTATKVTYTSGAVAYLNPKCVGYWGENSVRMDLTNQYQDFLYGDDGSNLSGPVTFYPRLYDGSDDKSSTVEEWRISANDGEDWDVNVGSHSGDTVTADINVGNRKITVSGLNASVGKLQVRALYNDTYYYADFTANKQSQDIYELILDPDGLAFNPADYTTQSITINAYRLDRKGTRSAVGFGTSGMSIASTTANNSALLRLFATYEQLSDGAAERRTTQVISGSFSITKEIAAASTDIYFELRKYSGADYTIADCETVPIAKSKDGNGIVSITSTFGISAYGTSSNASTPPDDIASSSTSSTYGWSTSQIAPTTARPFIWEKEATVFTDASKNTTRYFCIGRRGDDGQSVTGPAGKTGRFYYYAGDYSTAGNYQIEATQAPYVKYQGGFWMLDNKGVEPSSLPWPANGTPGTPSTSSSPWTKMTSEQQYYIAKAFFGEYAKLGSFIINGDWMISQYGVIYYSTGEATEIDTEAKAQQFYNQTENHYAYTFFDPNYPDANKPGAMNFAPSFAVDGLTGRSYQRSATILSTGSGPTIKIADGLIKFCGLTGIPNIILGVDDKGCAVLKFYDKDGNYKYDLGPNQIYTQLKYGENRFSIYDKLGPLPSDSNGTFYLDRVYDSSNGHAIERNVSTVVTTYRYLFHEGYSTLNGDVRSYVISGTSTPSEWNGKVYDSDTKNGYKPSGNKIAAGDYAGSEEEHDIGNTTIYSVPVYRVATDGTPPVYVGKFYFKGEGNAVTLTDNNGNTLTKVGKRFSELLQDEGFTKLS